jgi:hypothetical protein
MARKYVEHEDSAAAQHILIQWRSAWKEERLSAALSPPDRAPRSAAATPSSGGRMRATAGLASCPRRGPYLELSRACPTASTISLSAAELLPPTSTLAEQTPRARSQRASPPLHTYAQRYLSDIES